MVLTFRFLRGLVHFPWSWLLVPACALLLTAMVMQQGAPESVQSACLALTGFGCVVPFTWWWVRWLAPANSTGNWIDRRDDAAERARGVAAALEVAEVAGAAAMRARARTLRPSLIGLPRLDVLATSTTAYAVPLLRCGWVLPIGRTAWSCCEDVTLRVGGPRTGKTGSLACHALDAPGALVLTTTRTDLLDLTAAHRGRLGRVDVFNPTGLGMLSSTVRWSPLTGCTDLATAQRRARDLLPETHGEAERWDAQARALLALLLHAAALAGRRMSSVLEWVAPPDAIALGQITQALAASPASRTLIPEIRSIYSTNDRTLTSITASVLPAIRWVTDEAAAAIGDAPLPAGRGDDDLLDVVRLIAGGTDSLYLIGREGSCRPLIAAMTAEIAHQARMLAAAATAGRLDPPLTLILDEVPLTCGPIPLHDWTADMGGRGVTMHLVAQSLAQLRDTWGHDRAATILGNTSSLLVFGGIKAARDLEDLSTLCGTRLQQLDDDDRRLVPVMTPAQISSLPAGTALLLRNGLRPLVGRPPMAWGRRPRDPHAMLRALLDRRGLRATTGRDDAPAPDAPVRAVVTEQE